MSAQDSAIAARSKPAAATAAAAQVVNIGEQARLAARRRERTMSIASPVGLLLAWEIAGHIGWIDVRFFPVPSTCGWRPDSTCGV